MPEVISTKRKRSLRGTQASAADQADHPAADAGAAVVARGMKGAAQAALVGPMLSERLGGNAETAVTGARRGKRRASRKRRIDIKLSH